MQLDICFVFSAAFNLEIHKHLFENMQLLFTHTVFIAGKREY